MIRVVLPYHLRNLAQVGAEVTVEIAGPATQRAVLDALEARYPMLRGTIRDHVTYRRRPFLRFFACEEDLSHESPDAPLPDAVASGAEAFWVVGDATPPGAHTSDSPEKLFHFLCLNPRARLLSNSERWQGPTASTIRKGA